MASSGWRHTDYGSRLDKLMILRWRREFASYAERRSSARGTSSADVEHMRTSEIDMRPCSEGSPLSERSWIVEISVSSGASYLRYRVTETQYCIPPRRYR